MLPQETGRRTVAESPGQSEAGRQIELSGAELPDEGEECPRELGLPEGFRFHGLRHTGNTVVTQSGGTPKDAMVRAGQSSGKAALIYQHSTLERQKEVVAGLDARVRGGERHDVADEASGAEGLRRARMKIRQVSETRVVAPIGRRMWCTSGAWSPNWTRQQTTPKSLTWGFVVERVTRIELAL
ncbi:hypothetical protein [Streptomyces sp. NPDC088725]|uniref:hypothetical protein n=1 Tax=Streptomyces sp. NPDC088725 TaxID=3365873 RepID=UPI00381CC75D